VTNSHLWTEEFREIVNLISTLQNVKRSLDKKYQIRQKLVRIFNL